MVVSKSLIAVSLLAALAGPAAADLCVVDAVPAAVRSILVTLSWGERHNDPSGPQRAGPHKGRSVNDSSLSGLAS